MQPRKLVVHRARSSQRSYQQCYQACLVSSSNRSSVACPSRLHIWLLTSMFNELQQLYAVANVRFSDA
jgi:hypothetical protein